MDELYDTINPNTTNNILTETLTLLQGGSLTIAAGAKLIHRADAEQGFAGLTFDMQGGTFTSEGHVSAEAFTLSGGIASLANPGASTTSQGLSASSITISGGILNLGENVRVGGGTLDITGGIVRANGNCMLNVSTINIAGVAHLEATQSTMSFNGAINLGGNARLTVSEMTTNQANVLSLQAKENMTITENASITVENLAQLEIRPWVSGYRGKATVTQSGGSIVLLDDADPVNEYGGYMAILEGITYKLQGGSITLGEDTLFNSNGIMIISGGSLENRGEFSATHLDLSNAGNALDNAGTMSISSELICSDAQLKDLVAASNANLVIYTWKDGEYSVADLGQSATLDADMLSADPAALQKVAISQYGSLEAQDLTLNGDLLSIDKDGRIKTNGLSLNNSGSNFTVTSGNLVLNGESGSRLSAAGNGLLLNGGSTADAELMLGEFNSETGAPSTGGTLDANVTATSGTVSVVAGTWTLASGKTINVGSGGVLNVGGVMDAGYSNVESLPAKLIVNGSLLSANAGDGTQGINILSGGMLEADKNVFLSGTDRVNGLNVINTAANGTLRVTGLGTISSADVAAIQGNLMTGAGLFDIADAIIDDAQVAPDGTIDYATLPPGGVTSDSYREAVVINVNGPLSGNFAAVELAGGGSISVASNTTLILNGSKGGTLIADAAGAVADICVSGAFTLGEAGKSGSGVIGDVLLDSSTASLTSAGNGSFTAGAVDAAVDGYGSVKVTGGTLTVASIGATTPVGVADATDGALIAQGGINAQTVSSLNGSVQANDITAQTINSGANATVEALKDINAQRIVISDGTVLAGGSLTAAGFTIQNGLLQAAGDITISGPLASGDLTATGRVVSTNGNVTLQDKVAGLEGDIHAAGDITAQQEVKAPALSLIAGNAVKGTDIKVNSIYATRAETTGDLTVRSQLRLPGKGADASSVGGHLTLDRAYASVGDMTVNGNMILTNGTHATFDNLSVGGDISRVGQSADTEGSTFVVREVLDLNGSIITVDPTWGGTSSNMAVNSINDDAAAADILINGGVAVGQNAYAAIGTADSAWLPAVAGPLSQDGTSAALGIFRPVALAAGYKLYVNGALADTALAGGGTGYDAAPVDSATFEPGSLLVVNGGDAQIAGGTAAITFANSGTLHVADGAKLAIADIAVGENITLLSNVSNLDTAFNGTSYADAASTGWKGQNLLTNSPLIGLTPSTDGNSLTFTVTQNDARDVYPGLSGGMADAVNALYGNGHADVDSLDMGTRFLSRATDNRYLADANATVRTVESAARMTVAGAVPQMTKMASDAGSAAVVDRLGVANAGSGIQSVNSAGQPAGDDELGLALWIAPTWQNRTGFNMDAGSLDGGFSGNIGGVVLGADYTFNNAIRAGIALNLGGGYARSAGDFSTTTNDMSYWGLDVYAGWTSGNFSLMADAGYTGAYHKLEQELDAGMAMRDLKADVQAEAWQAGLRAEYTFETSVLDITPHAGVRYLNLHTWGYDVKSNGTVLEADSMYQNIWTFPVGITFSKDFALENGWHVRPSADFTVIPATGDIKGRQDVRFAGLPGSYEMETQTMDYLTWQGGLGLEVGNDDLSLGINYTLQAGETGTGHGVFAMFRYEF